MNFYKRHLGDMAKSCGHLSQGQQGAYDLLIDWMYANEKLLPLDMGDLYRIGRGYTPAERANVDKVLNSHFTKTEQGYAHGRIAEEIAKANAIADTNRRIAEEREARKRADREAREAHEALHDTSNGSLHEACSKREPSQTPDSRLQTSSSNNPASETISRAPDGARARVREACKTLAAAGVDCSTQDAHLHLALNAGITAEALVALTKTRKGAGKGIAYLVKTLIGQQADAAGVAPAVPAVPVVPPEQKAREAEIARLENSIYDARHLCDTSGLIDVAERDRRIADAKAQIRELTQGAPA